MHRDDKFIFAGKAVHGLKIMVCLGVFCLIWIAEVSGGVDPKLDWPGWRGPTRNGIAASGQQLPVEWSESERVVWKTPLPGRGHGSPTVVGERIYLPTADREKQTQSVLCLERRSGRIVWQSEVHGSSADPGKHSNSSAASSTVSCDGERLFINFLNGGAVYTSALDLDGKVLWQRKVCDYITHQGFGSSPVLHEGLVMVSADHRGGGVVAALEQKSGRIVWSQARPKLPNYMTPAIFQVDGRTQMILGGCNLVTSFEPMTGKKLWEVSGSTEECVATAVTDGTRVFTSGGYPRNHTVAIVADGSGKVAWQNNSRVYVPSMIAKEGHIYAVMDAGLAVCWKSETGEELWKERLGGEFFASPVMAGEKIYASNVAGKTFVFEATPSHFKLLAQNQIGDEAYASPVICGGRIYLRVAKRGAERQEFLYCIGDSANQAAR
jgi:outer membrane protein assembly factor BamB